MKIPASKLLRLKRPRLISTAAIDTAVTLVAAYGTAGAVILNCPQVIVVKAVGAPYPWENSTNQDALLPFAEASYSCSNGPCTLSCAYSAPSNVYTFLDYKVSPGVCNYTNQGRSFDCSSLPPWHHHQKH
jgi:hypothetical protein